MVVNQPDVIVIHETGGRKYLEALIHLQSEGALRSLEFFEASVLRKFLRSLIREKASPKEALARAFQNAAFRAAIPTLAGKTIILGVAPWDFRFLLHQGLRKRNRFIYHTSWPYWELDAAPRLYGKLTGLLRREWLKKLGQPDIEIVAVTPAAADAVTMNVSGKHPTVIPHVVSDAFFTHCARPAEKLFRLIFVGEWIPEKGLGLLPAILDRLADFPIHLDLVGGGPMAGFVASQLATRTNVTIHGRITDRSKLAEVMSNTQLLLVPSQRTSKWEELFGMVIAEAMASGVPALASDHIGPRTLIQDGYSGFLVREDDVAEIAGKIEQLALSPGMWQLLSTEAKLRGRTYRLKTVSALWRNLLCANACALRSS